ncbi:hypothetical protein AVEN_74152-1 [Araneus ventricosus]|uniref:Uncharacterized protein n=1 Tax=Araneus ventricosus TaxID=182803 RepID=A0A4Y2J1X7_ARAVE|nr:hypothetical protein AVEN_74152-1 [Araneus ventricosus]
MINLHSNVRPVPQVGLTLLESLPPRFSTTHLGLRSPLGSSSGFRIAETVLCHRSLLKAPPADWTKKYNNTKNEKGKINKWRKESTEHYVSLEWKVCWKKRNR